MLLYICWRRCCFWRYRIIAAVTLTSRTYRFVLLLTAVIAGWQIAHGLPEDAPLPLVAYTVGFGVLLLVCLWLPLMGLEVLHHPLVVVVAALVPLSFSLGLVGEYWPQGVPIFLALAVAGMIGIAYSRMGGASPRLGVLIVALVHGVAGLVIVGMPVWAWVQGLARPGILGIGAGGALIGLSGLALLGQRLRWIPTRGRDFTPVLPWSLLLTLICLVIGFNLR